MQRRHLICVDVSALGAARLPSSSTRWGAELASRRSAREPAKTTAAVEIARTAHTLLGDAPRERGHRSAVEAVITPACCCWPTRPPPPGRVRDWCRRQLGGTSMGRPQTASPASDWLTGMPGEGCWPGAGCGLVPAARLMSAVHSVEELVRHVLQAACPEPLNWPSTATCKHPSLRPQ